MKYCFAKDVMIDGVPHIAGHSADHLEKGHLESCLYVGHVREATPADQPADDAPPEAAADSKPKAKPEPKPAKK